MMSHNYSLAVICGLARSGTTYVGKVLSKARGVHLIHEPLNKDFGVKDVPSWYLYADGPDQENHAGTKKLLREIVSLRAGWTRSSPPEYPLLTRLSKRVYGGRSGLAWSALRLQKGIGFPLHTVCWKDPFATFAIGHLIKAFNAKAVCLTKHPCALYLSQKRMGQVSHIEDLFAQQELRERCGPDISSDTWKSALSPGPVGVALLWKIMARAIITQAEDLSNLSVVHHEDLCIDPTKTIKGICAHLGIAYGGRLESYILRTSQGKRIHAKPGRLHFFKRNSLALKDAWRDKISPQEEAVIKEVVGDDIHLIYEQW